ncbi:AN1-type zinc finger protein 2A-like isoform X2 [Leptidea sinapis]|nr:AN1-type zinc finger protein 2A-like isoform X2 [Leptidea sinapis]
MKCDACREVFCSEHFTYTNHNCPASNARDVQVPVCPLCGVPVPGKRGEPPDVGVSAHIDNQCTSDNAKERRKKIFTNKCSYKGCKTKELVPLVCAECSLNYCLRHRHTADHACEGKLAAKRRKAAEAAMARIKANQNKPNTGRVSTITSSDIQGNMTEDEALAHALAISMQDGQDLQQDSTLRSLRQRVGGEPNSRCSVS